MSEKTNKMITIVLALLITVAALTIIYVNLPQENDNDTTDNTPSKNNDQNNTQNEEKILTVTYENEKTNYTLEELEELESFTASGSYVKTKLLPDTVVINGPWNFTGVKITTILDEFSNLPENYNITVTSSDGWTSTYTYNQTQGNVNFYETDGNLTEDASATMILAYKEEGEYLTVGDDEPGPLRIAFIGSKPITESNLWSNKVVSIEITEV